MIVRRGLLRTAENSGGGYTLDDIFMGTAPSGSVVYTPSADIPGFGISGRKLMTELILNMGNNEFARSAISNNTALTRIIINKDADSTKGITDYSVTNNTALKQIIIRGRVCGWGQSALRGNGALEIVDIEHSEGNYNTSLSSNAFYGSGNNFKTIILRQNSVVELNANTFSNTPFAGANGAKAYVPSSLIDSYKSNSIWSTLYANGYVTFEALENSVYASKTWYES